MPTAHGRCHDMTPAELDDAIREVSEDFQPGITVRELLAIFSAVPDVTAADVKASAARVIASPGPLEICQTSTVHTGYGFATRCGCGWRAIHDTEASGHSSATAHLQTVHGTAAGK